MRHHVNASIVLALWVGGASTAHAAPITSLEADVSGSFVIVTMFGSDLLLGSGAVTGVNNAPPADGLFAQILGFAVNPTGSSVSDGHTTYSMDSRSDAVKNIFGPGGTTAQFQLFLTFAVVNNSDPDAVVLHGTEVLLQDQIGDAYDFSPFSSGGRFTLILTAPGANFNTLLTSGGEAQVSGTITQTAVPEPGTLLLFAAAAPLLVRAVGRQKRPKR